MLLYLTVDHLYDASLVLEDFFIWSSIPPITKRLISRLLWSSFGRSTEGKFYISLSIRRFQKVQFELIYFYVVRKNKK